jgi:hypothetical protein
MPIYGNTLPLTNATPSQQRPPNAPNAAPQRTAILNAGSLFRSSQGVVSRTSFFDCLTSSSPHLAAHGKPASGGTRQARIRRHSASPHLAAHGKPASGGTRQARIRRHSASPHQAALDKPASGGTSRHFDFWPPGTSTSGLLALRLLASWHFDFWPHGTSTSGLLALRLLASQHFGLSRQARIWRHTSSLRLAAHQDIKPAASGTPRHQARG